MSEQFRLLKKKRFAPLFITQFLGAFNDNLFKNALVVLLTFHTAQWSTLSAGVLANLAAGIFILPFFLFSAFAGQLADKYDKAKLARLTKLLELVITLVALWGFIEHSLYILLSALFLLGLQSTLFGPVKYSLLPQHLKQSELLGGNALIEAGTFVSILLGTLAGGVLAGYLPEPAWIAGAGALVAVTGLIASLRIPPAPAPEPRLQLRFNLVTATLKSIEFARQDRSVFLSIPAFPGSGYMARYSWRSCQPLPSKSWAAAKAWSPCYWRYSPSASVRVRYCERLTSRQVEIGLVLWAQSV